MIEKTKDLEICFKERSVLDLAVLETRNMLTM